MRGAGAPALILALGFGGLVALAVAFFVLLPRGSKIDCDRVQLPNAAAYTSLDPPSQESLIVRLNLCSRLDGLTTGQLTAALGVPASASTSRIVYDVRSNGNFSTADGSPGPPRPPNQLVLSMQDGRVTDTRWIDVDRTR